MSYTDQIFAFLTENATPILCVLLVLKLLYRFLSATAAVDEPEPAGSRVKHIKSMEEFDGIIANNQTVVAKFSAEWCPPCKKCRIPFAEWSASDEMADVVFLHIDVDKTKDVAQANGIKSMPTFKIFTNGKESGSVGGWNKSSIAQLLKKDS